MGDRGFGTNFWLAGLLGLSAFGCAVGSFGDDAQPGGDGGPDVATPSADAAGATDARAIPDGAVMPDARVAPDATVSPDASEFADATVSPDASEFADATVSPDAMSPDAMSPDAMSPDAGALPCAPNGDGVLAAGELPLGPGPGVLLAAAGVAVDTAGDDAGGGDRLWAMDGAHAGESSLARGPRGLDGEWFASAFPEASYVVRRRAGSLLLEVYQRTEDALLLLGRVSTSSGALRTEVRFTPAVTVLRLPAVVGESWATDTVASGVESGLGVTRSERWEVSAETTGTLALPAEELPALLVRTTRIDAGLLGPTTRRELTFYSECRGVVAEVDSFVNEASRDFAFAAEVRRLP